jgi:Protein of unknown function (DUF3352)
LKPRLVLPAIAALVALGVTGCAGSSDSGDPANLAPAGSPLFVEATVRPQGELKSNVQALAKDVAGIDDVGQRIVDELQSSATDSGADVSYAKDIEPWLGEKAGVFFQHFDGSDFSGGGAVIQSTDTAATQKFVDKLAKSNDNPVKDASYGDIDYKVDSSDGTALGVVDEFLVFGEDEGAFKAAVDASQGESLDNDDAYANTIETAPAGSLADVYVDVGGLFDQAGTSQSDQAVQIFKGAGIDPTAATALASLVPGSDQVEIDLSTDLGDGSSTAGASGLLGSFPADAFAAFSSAGFGERLLKAIDGLNEAGIPPDVPPNQLKSALKSQGIDLDRIVGSLGDMGVFAEGGGRGDLGGALVLTTDKASEATTTVSNLGLLLRLSQTPGVTAVSGKASGFSVRSPDLGHRPIVVVAKDERIAIGYGLAAALQGLSAGSGPTLSGSASYQAAVDSLNGTPIAGYVDGGRALSLAGALGASSDPGFKRAKKYLAKVDFLALGTGAKVDQVTAKLIAGFR